MSTEPDAGQPPVAPSARLPGPATSSFWSVVLSLAAVGLSLALLRDLSSLIAPTFLALNLLIVVYPLFRRLHAAGVPRGAAALAVAIAVLGVLAVFVWGMAYSITAMITQLSGYGDRFTAIYHQALRSLTRLGFSQDVLLARLKALDPSSMLSFATSVLANAQGSLSLLTVLVLSLLFMVMDIPAVHGRLDAASRTHPSFVAGLYDFAEGVRRYWVVTTVFGLIVAALDWGVLMVVGVPLPFVWALLSFITNYIPNLGFVIGVIPPALIAWFDKGWVSAVVVVVAYVVLNFVVQSLIQPKVAGEAVGLTATVTFLSLFLWTYIFGALGALIALPCSLLVKSLLIDTDPSLRWLDALIAARTPPASGSAGGGKLPGRASRRDDDTTHAVSEQ
ncbi:MAG TPA: AI-2E family transporter [Propionibacteriaceae bacterium]|nr:AI-2E family transporter [Propionibacteriaceae bacterium]